MNKLRPIAIYLPQFYPIPENDEWWGKGFTEWTNCVKAKSLLKNHYQPHLPSELGFYDLRVPEVREEQSKLAVEHGIYGFCYYHYWFNGRLLLNRPIEEIHNSKKPDFPFCFCWANENWTRVWNGGEKEVLLHQDYCIEDDILHIKYLFNYFNDKRYIKVENKPLFIIYRPEALPDVKKTIETWREEAIKAGIGELYLCYFENGIQDQNPEYLGFDAAIEFQPNSAKLPPVRNYILKKILHKLKIRRYISMREYSDLIEYALKNSTSSYKRYNCVTPMWDNTSRRGIKGSGFINSTPQLYEMWLEKVVADFYPYSKEENFVFINAWNEWAEGNHLEPCQKWGRQYLVATKNALNALNSY